MIEPILIQPLFRLEEVVYLKTDTDQDPRMVVGISLNANESILYTLVCGTETSDHYECEISKTKETIL